MSEYFANIFYGLKSFAEGLQLTMRHFRNRKDLVATLQYPHEKWPIEDRHIGFPLEEYNIIRSRLNVDIDDCIGCLQCERACPVDCIKIETIKPPKGSDFDCGITSNGTKMKMLVARFSIDMTECMFCNLCTFPCPEDCIYMVGGPNSSKHEIEYEYASRDRESLIFQFANPSESDVLAVGGENYLRTKAGLPPLAPEVPVKPVETVSTATEKPTPTAGEPDVKVLNGITDRMVRATAKKAFMAAARGSSDLATIAKSIQAALEEAGKFTDEAKSVLDSLAVTQTPTPVTVNEVSSEAKPDIKTLNVLEDKMVRGLAKKIFMAENRGGKSASEMVDAILAGLKDADKLTPETEAVVRQLAPEAPVSPPKPSAPATDFNVKVLNGIEDRMTRGLAKKAFMAAQREGKSASEIIQTVQTALSEADKLTDDVKTLLQSIGGDKA